MPQAYAPLTPEQYQKAKGAGFSSSQIIENEKKRKAATASPPSLGGKILGAAKGVSDFINQNIARPFTDIAAIPVQAAAKALGQKDPYAGGAMAGIDIAPVDNGLRKLGSAAEVASYAFPYGTVAKGATAVAKPLLGKTLGKLAGNVASGVAGGYGVDVGANLASGKTGGEALKPGVGTALGGAIPGVPAVLGAGARAVGESLGVSTGTGYGVIKEALQASSAGGERAKAFTEALRGRTAPDKIVEEARSALSDVVKNRSKAYTEGLDTLKTSTKQFDTTPVAEKFNSLLEDSGVSFSKKGVPDFSRSPGLGRYERDLTQMSKVIADWGKKKGDLTITGIDKLKQTIDEFRYGTQDARRFDRFVTALRNETKALGKNEPGYLKMVSGYEESTGLIKEIARGLSLGNASQTDTAFRKLSSVLRTNNEFRKELIDELNKASGGYLTSSIAGQQLSEALPRGLARQIEGFGALGAVATGGKPVILTLLKLAAFGSPRIVGEMVNALGISKRVFMQLIDRIAPQGAQFPGDKFLKSPEGKKAINYVKNIQPGLSMKDVSGGRPGPLPKAQGGVPNTPEAFGGFEDITSKILDDLKGRASISKQYLLDALNRPEIKQAEKNIVRELLKEEGDQIGVKRFAAKLKSELLPLTSKKFGASSGGSPRYESIVLPEEVRGQVESYSENIYESPIKTSAGDVHFNYGSSPTENYFAHSRIEDLPSEIVENNSLADLVKSGRASNIEEARVLRDKANTKGTRRVIELQSDLFQKDRLEKELQFSGPQNRETESMNLQGDEKKYVQDFYSKYYGTGTQSNEKFGRPPKDVIKRYEELVSKNNKIGEEMRGKEVAPLEPYRNTWHERVIREEVKQAALDGKTKLQFPTGETAMRVEGLAGESGHVPPGAQVGDYFDYAGQQYRVVGDNFDNSVTAIPEDQVKREFNWELARDEEIDSNVSDFEYEAERQHDISRYTISDEFEKGFKKAVREAKKADSQEPLANFLSDHNDEIRAAVEADIKERYDSAEEMAEYFTDNHGDKYIAAGDDILYVPEFDSYSERMERGSGGELDVDKDNPIYKFYEKEVGKYLQKKYGAQLITDPQGVTWWELNVPKEKAKLPVEAFAAIPALGIGSQMSAGRQNESRPESRGLSPKPRALLAR